MTFDTVKLAFFSPTGTTKKILQAIAQGYGARKIKTLDLTIAGTDDEISCEINDELIVFGVPVYEGRAAKTALDRLRHFKGHDTPAVIVVMYGNRDFEDALLELTDFAKELGFLPIACGAFIGEHSFAREDRPMANGRPDESDLRAAKEFGLKIHTKARKIAHINGADLMVTPPGNKKYIEHDRRNMEDKAASTLEEKCTLCGECKDVCPVGAITIENDKTKTDNLACILCNACVKNCPTGARVVDDPMINKLVNWVSKNFQDRREPEVFI